MSEEVRREYTTTPRVLGEEYTERRGNGVEVTYVVTLLEPCSLFDETDGWKQHSEPVHVTDPPDPTSLPCVVCDELIADRDWAWAAMSENGPVHDNCFMDDAELLALLDEPDEDGELADVLHYADGVNNATICRDGRIFRHAAGLGG